MENLGLEPKGFFSFEEALKYQKVSHKERSDKLIWGASKDGRYCIKRGYNLIIQSQRWEAINMPLKLCQDSACLPKVGIFL